MTSTISKVTTLPPKKQELTYLECLLNHIDALSEEQKNAPIDMLLVVGNKEMGNFYSVLTGTSIVKAVGLLEVTKLLVLNEYS